ncbi:MAG: hypothetical protein OXE52_09385 [Chloroflexi bacterium]|nr:hypothetical protein [Chloroflexota bacterium]
MAVLVWSDRDGSLGNSIRSGRRVALSAEEYRAEAEDLDQQLDSLLDMAWHALTIITRRENGKPRFNSFEQVWILGRAVHISEVMRHEAMQGEVRTLLWQALTAKAWYGIRHDMTRDPRWRQLIPSGKNQWRTRTNDKRLDRAYDFLEVGFWLREQQLQDAGEVFSWEFSNARKLYVRPTLRSLELRKALLHWLHRQTPEIREFAEITKTDVGFIIFVKALNKRFPASGPGSALLPQHYPEDELRVIVSDVLDTARDAHFL